MLIKRGSQGRRRYGTMQAFRIPDDSRLHAKRTSGVWTSTAWLEPRAAMAAGPRSLIIVGRGWTKMQKHARCEAVLDTKLYAGPSMEIL